jgi:CDP-diglyceride synthetase
MCGYEWSVMTAAIATATTTPHYQTSWLQVWIFPAVSVLLTLYCHDNDPLFLLGLLVTTTVVIVVTSTTQQATTTKWLQGLVLITIPFRAWLAVVQDHNHGFVHTVSLLLTVWNCDTGALVTGRLVGGKLRRSVVPTALRHQLQRISPKKSVEGLLGGLVFGILTYTIMLPILWRLVQFYNIPTGNRSSNSAWQLATTFTTFTSTTTDVWVMGLVLSVAAIVGDLAESALKRQNSVKDTGRLLPGHGGVLDRFDSSLVAVVIYHYCTVHATTYRPARGY